MNDTDRKVYERFVGAPVLHSTDWSGVRVTTLRRMERAGLVELHERDHTGFHRNGGMKTEHIWWAKLTDDGENAARSAGIDAGAWRRGL